MPDFLLSPCFLSLTRVVGDKQCRNLVEDVRHDAQSVDVFSRKLLKHTTVFEKVNRKSRHRQGEVGPRPPLLAAPAGNDRAANQRAAAELGQPAAAPHGGPQVAATLLARCRATADVLHVAADLEGDPPLVVLDRFPPVAPVPPEMPIAFQFCT